MARSLRDSVIDAVIERANGIAEEQKQPGLNSDIGWEDGDYGRSWTLGHTRKAVPKHIREIVKALEAMKDGDR